MLFHSVLKVATITGVGMVGTAGKISAFRPQDPQFDPRLCQDSNICATFFSA